MRNAYQRKRTRFVLPLFATAFMTVLIVSSARAQSKDTILTDRVVQLKQQVSSNGFVHPGISCNAETLSIMREKVIRGVSPWADYFEGLRRTPYAKLDRRPRFVEQITNDGGIGGYAQDAHLIWTHTILYVVTGNEEYRKRPVEIIKWYGGRTEKSFFPRAFPDSHIKIGKYVYTMCSAVDILRTTEPKDKSLAVTQEMVDALNANCIDHIRKNCIERNHYFMNQHSYAIMGFLAGTILADDVDGYKRAVEWTTVNATAENQGRNGSIKEQIRLITRNDKTGQPVEPTLQVVEMGRDQPHANGNIDNLLMMVKTIDFQKTRVDPVHGTVTDKPDGVSSVHFLDDRLLKGSLLRVKYNLGYGLPWVPTYSETPPGQPGTTYDQISYYGRGGLGGSGIAGGYYYYKGIGYDLDEGLYKLFKVAFNAEAVDREYGARSGLFINQIHNYAFDFWIGLSAGASDAKPDPEKARRALAVELPPLEVVRDGRPADAKDFEHNFVDLSAHASPGDIYPGSPGDVPLAIQRDADGTQYVRMTLVAEPRSMVVSMSIAPQMGLRVRSDKLVKLSFYPGEDYTRRESLGTIFVPHTANEWTYVTADFKSDNLLYIQAITLDGPAQVDFDRIDADAGKLSPLVFAVPARDALFPAYVGGKVEKTYTAGNQNATYVAKGLPEGATLDTATGRLTWSPRPGQTGKHAFYVMARSGASTATLPVTIHVEKDLQAALDFVAKVYDPSQKYETATLTAFKTALEARDFDALVIAADRLALLTPKLPDGSLDYRKTWSSTIHGSAKMADGDPLTWGGLWGFDKSVTMDFGRNFKVKSRAFGMQARDGFPIRVSQAVVYGSNNRFEWTLLTENAAKTSPDFQTLTVKTSQQETPYRFLRFFMPARAYGIFEIAELRVYGERVEDYSPDYHKAYAKGFEDGTFRPDQPLTRAEAASFLANVVDDYTDKGAYSCDYSDVDRKAWYYDDLAYMTRKGLIGPANGKAFAPEMPITRGELAGIMCKMNKLEGRVEFALRDVTSTMPNAAEIHRVAAQGWLVADSEKEFHPNDPVSRAQFVTAVNMMLGRTDAGGENPSTFKDVDRSHWAHNAIMEATQTHAASATADGGFLFTTFRDETTPLSEQIYFAVSEDGKDWQSLNGGSPVLVSDVGDKGVRDSFLIRSHDGKKAWIIATDLCVHHNRDWGRNTRAGSKSIVVWDSTDLVNWSPPRLAQVAPDDAGCVWAPEAIYDEESGDYLVYWASTTKSDNYGQQRIWAARTKDFVTFDKPFVYLEKPNHVIDINIVHDGNAYYRFTKDDKDKSVSMATSKKLTGPWQEMEQFASGKGKNFEGPICYRLKLAAADQPPLWCVLLDNVSDRIGKGAYGYMPFVTTDLSSGKFTPAKDFHFPYHFRHGSVLPITKAELERLKSTYP